MDQSRFTSAALAVASNYRRAMNLQTAYEDACRVGNVDRARRLFRLFHKATACGRRAAGRMRDCVK